MVNGSHTSAGMWQREKEARRVPTRPAVIMAAVAVKNPEE